MKNAILSQKWFPLLNKLSLILLCILMIDCCITGSGRMLMIGPVSVRMLVWGLTILTAVPLMLVRLRELLTNKLIWAFGAWVIWLLISTVIGLSKGNNISVMITDFKGYAYFALLPAAICILDSKEKVHTLMKAMMYASGVLGIIILIHFYLFIWAEEPFTVLYHWGLKCSFSAMSAVSPTMPRLFFYSTNYLLAGCAFATYFQVIQKKIRLDFSLLTGINLVCLLMSYTRSVYLAVGVAIAVLVAAFLLTIRKTASKRFWTHLGVSVVAFCLILSAFGIAAKTEYVSYAITRTLLSFAAPSVTQPDPTVPGNPSTPTTPIVQPTTPVVDPNTQWAQQETAQSDLLRSRIQAELREMIRKSPIIGNGMGASLEWRSDNEYFYLDLLAKNGIVGLVLYMSPLLTAIAIMLMRGKELAYEKFLCSAWICVLLGFMAFSYFNPYMNAALGILFFCCVLAVVNVMMKKPVCEAGE